MNLCLRAIEPKKNNTYQSKRRLILENEQRFEGYGRDNIMKRKED